MKMWSSEHLDLKEIINQLLLLQSENEEQARRIKRLEDALFLPEELE
jgi:hypothetical protein